MNSPEFIDAQLKLYLFENQANDAQLENPTDSVKFREMLMRGSTGKGCHCEQFN